MRPLNIAIIGCGYLGTELARFWKQQGHFMTVTTRNSEKLDPLSKVAQKSVILKGNDEKEFLSLIANNDVLVIVIAADSPEHYESAYLKTSQIIRHLALDMDLRSEDQPSELQSQSNLL